MGKLPSFYVADPNQREDSSAFGLSMTGGTSIGLAMSSCHSERRHGACAPLIEQETDLFSKRQTAFPPPPLALSLPKGLGGEGTTNVMALPYHIHAIQRHKVQLLFLSRSAVKDLAKEEKMAEDLYHLPE